MCFIFFFFSSRRRHTRSLCDWNSDVCSSDLGSVCCSSCAPLFVTSRARGFPGNQRCSPFTLLNAARGRIFRRSEEHTSELQSHSDLVCRLLLEKKKKNDINVNMSINSKCENT